VITHGQEEDRRTKGNVHEQDGDRNEQNLRGADALLRLPGGQNTDQAESERGRGGRNTESGKRTERIEMKGNYSQKIEGSSKDTSV